MGLTYAIPPRTKRGKAALCRQLDYWAATADKLDAKVRPFLVLADANGTDTTRTINAGRITPSMELSDEEWEFLQRLRIRLHGR